MFDFYIIHLILSHQRTAGEVCRAWQCVCMCVCVCACMHSVGPYRVGDCLPGDCGMWLFSEFLLANRLCCTMHAYWYSTMCRSSQQTWVNVAHFDWPLPWIPQRKICSSTECESSQRAHFLLLDVVTGSVSDSWPSAAEATGERGLRDSALISYLISSLAKLRDLQSVTPKFEFSVIPVFTSPPIFSSPSNFQKWFR